jgi:hypothetical protein
MPQLLVRMHADVIALKPSVVHIMAAVAQFEDLSAYTLSMVDPPGETYSEDFGDRFADFWSVERGAWTAASGEYRSTAGGFADIALSELAQIVLNNSGRDLMYSLKSRMLNAYRGSGKAWRVLVSMPRVISNCASVGE